MKNLFYTLVLVSSFSFGQIERDLGDFSKITSFDRINVLLVLSDQNKILLEGDDASEVELINKNGELKVRMPITKMLNGDKITATIFFKEISEVEANEGSVISCIDLLKSLSFSIIAKENSEVKLFIDTEKLSVKCANRSKVILEGSATYQDVFLNTGGIYEAEKLETELTSVSCNAGGNANIKALNLVDAKIKAGGNITIFGNPKQIKESVIAGGNIKKAE